MRWWSWRPQVYRKQVIRGSSDNNNSNNNHYDDDNDEDGLSVRQLWSPFPVGTHLMSVPRVSGFGLDHFVLCSANGFWFLMWTQSILVLASLGDESCPTLCLEELLYFLYLPFSVECSLQAGLGFEHLWIPPGTGKGLNSNGQDNNNHRGDVPGPMETSQGLTHAVITAFLRQVQLLLPFLK